MLPKVEGADWWNLRQLFAKWRSFPLCIRGSAICVFCRFFRSGAGLGREWIWGVTCSADMGDFTVSYSREILLLLSAVRVVTSFGATSSFCLF